MNKKTVLIVDDEPNNLTLMKEILAPVGYKLLFAKDGQRALEIAEEQRPDIVLLDVMMPEMSGYDVCSKMKKSPQTANIPVIFVTAMNETTDEQRGFDFGAVDYMTKPVNPSIVRARVQTHLSLVKVMELEISQRDAVFMLGVAGHYNDNDTGAHIWRMGNYAFELARGLGMDMEYCQRLSLAAPMHDTGKIGIPDEILKAPRKLEPDEWDLMKKHSQFGYDILSQSTAPIFIMAAEVAQSHHERWDGSGYPQGLSGEDIPLSARIVAIADVFDALTSIRPYKKAWTVEESFENIREGREKQFDPTLVDLLLSMDTTIVSIQDKWKDKNLMSFDEYREIISM